MKYFLIMLLLLAPSLLRAEPAAPGYGAFDYGAFGQMPVLQDGRIKPLDSFARVMLRRIHGDSGYEERSAAAWLAFVLFTPSDAMKACMFPLTSAHAAQMLGLPERGEHCYSFEELAPVFSRRSDVLDMLAHKDKNMLTQDEAEILRIYGATNDFAELAGSFSLLMPLADVEDSVRTALGLPADRDISYLDLQKYRQALTDAAQAVAGRAAPEAYSTADKALVRVATLMALQEEANQDNALLRVISPAWGGDEWLSPWGVLKSSAGSPRNMQTLRGWRALAESYRRGDARGWQSVSQTLLADSLAAVEPSRVWRLMLEYYYHRLYLLPLAACFYALGLLLIATPATLRHGAMLGTMSLLAGMVLHAAALSMRMLILLRPPVSTLYESLIFVSFVAMAVSYALGGRRGGTTMLLAGGSTSLFLLLASWVFAGDGDTLGVLVAVLNTNFWLATHVVCITTGYGCALVTGAIAHLYLFRRAVNNASDAALKPVSSLLHLAALLALLFTAVGTMLGGIWADQSWGRFWGWDPKENGALLIVLWLIWTLHGRIAGQIGAMGFAALLALTNIVVALAWVGVNLLSVGLHSYGFTDTAAEGLVLFCAAETAYVAIMLMIVAGRRHTADRNG